jgi:hypothetical protein
MFTTIGAALGQPTTDRDRQPVRRHSHMAGRCEGLFWHRTDRQSVRRILLAAKRYDVVGRASGRKNGPLGHVAIEILELMTNVVSFRTGRLEPSLAYLMKRLRRSKDAVVRALSALREHGFVNWLRRFEAVEAEGPGPRIKQVSNAYQLALPPRALRLLGIHGQNAPMPEDLTAEREARAMEIAAMKVGLSLEEFAVLEVDDNRLGSLLAQMGRRLDLRESGKRSVTGSTIFS